MFAIPTLPDLLDRVRKAFRAELPGTDAWLWPNNIGPTAKVFAGGLHELFGRIDYVQRQKFALTADGEWLDRHGEEIGLTRLAATPATGTAVLTSGAGGLTMAVGALFSRSDGVVFGQAIDYAAILQPGESVNVPLVSIGTGRTENTAGGAALTLQSGFTGLGSASFDSGGATGGAEIESDDDFRGRILFRKRNPPHGGAASDYVIWATQRPGVTRVFVERLWAGPGTLRMFFLMDDLRPAGIPYTSDVEAMRHHLDALKPAGAALTVAAPVPVVVPVTIIGMEPDTTAVRAAVIDSLKSTFRGRGRVAGDDNPVQPLAYLASPFAFSRSWIWQAVANATGETSHSIGLPASDVPLAAGQIAVLGGVTFTAAP